MLKEALSADTRRFIALASACKQLSAKEEVALARRGDADAHKALATSVLRTVAVLALHYGYAADVDDLLSAGCIGAMEAARRFDADRGVRFITLAVWWIRAYVLKQIRDERSVVHRPNCGRRRQIKCDPIPDTQLDDIPIGSDPITHPDDRLERDEVRRAVQLHLADLAPRLDHRRRMIFDEQFSAAEPRPLRAIGESLGISGERVRQLGVPIVAELRRRLADYAGGG